MKKFVCTVCGYVHEGDAAPANCPVCKVPAEKFNEQKGEREWAAEHVVGVAQGVREDIIADLQFTLHPQSADLIYACPLATGSDIFLISVAVITYLDAGLQLEIPIVVDRPTVNLGEITGEFETR